MKKLLTIMLLWSGVTFAQQTEWQAPAEAAAKQNPLKDKAHLAAGGKKIFSKTCATCHDAGPNQKGPHLDSEAVQQETDGALFWKISTGNSRRGMPSFSSLPDGQRWQLVLYIRSLAHSNSQ
jgi:mono/diheme cytochrome c family protein